jgi:hypothetical protein
MANGDEALREVTKEAEAGRGCTIAHLLAGVNQSEMIAAFTAMTQQSEKHKSEEGHDAVLGWGSQFIDQTHTPSGDLSTDLNGLMTSSSNPVQVTLDRINDKGDMNKVIADILNGTAKTENLLTAKFVNGKMVTESCQESEAPPKK